MMLPNNTQRLRVIGVLALVMAPHLLRVPPWVSLLTVTILVWQTLAVLRGWPQPGWLLRLALAVLVFVGIYATFGRIDGQNAGVALLVLMLALKLTESRRHRDIMMLLSLCFFLLVTHFLFSQALVMVVFLAVTCWLITACFIDANHPQGALPARTALTSAGALMTQALPVAALLFVLFPRIPGPLWGLPSDSGASARTGLSESMAPGAISQLALSDAVAFRVRFEGSTPPPAQRYWRGPVFWGFDGQRWDPGQPERFATAPPKREVLGKPVHYRLTLEPHRRNWLLALDLPGAAPRASYIDAAGSLRTREPVTTRSAYRLTSYPEHRLQTQAPADLLDYARRLPASGNSQARALAERWRQDGLAPSAMVATALRRFNAQSYRYTLQPPALPGRNGIDRFLFETQAGFCEHYAGAFTFLMRAAGVPARVVTGYQGGQPGMGGDYLIVRSADAHAWSEVWLAGQGWVRVDPTAAVAPERIETGLNASLAADEPVPYLARGAGELLFRARLGWDYVNAAWNGWFLAYGPSLQAQFMRALGLPDWRAMILALTVLLTGFLAVLGVMLVRTTRAPPPADPVQAAWLGVCRRLAAAGIPRAPAEGPLDYAERVARQRPTDAARFQRLARWYARLRYRSADERECERFVRAARALRLPRTADGKRTDRRAKPVISTAER